MTTPTDQLNIDARAFKAAARRYTTNTDPNARASAFQALVRAAELYLATRETFRKWIHGLPPPKGESKTHTTL